MTDVQARVYERILHSEDVELVRDWHEPCDCGRKQTRGMCCYTTGSDPERAPLYFSNHPNAQQCNASGCPLCLTLPLMMKLSQCANHLELLKARKSDETHTRRNVARYAKMAFGSDVERIGGVDQSDQWIKMGDESLCGKLPCLKKILHHHNVRGDKV